MARNRVCGLFYRSYYYTCWVCLDYLENEKESITKSIQPIATLRLIFSFVDFQIKDDIATAVKLELQLRSELEFVS